MAEVVFHSSGSTGEPKEILRTEASLLEDARRLVAAFPEIWEKKPDVVASVQSEHMYGALWRVRAPAVVGCTVVPTTVVSVEELTAIASVRRELIFITTPSFLEKAIRHADFAMLKGVFRAIVTSGSPLRRETAFAVADKVWICPLEIYGSTEAGTVAWRRQTVAGETFTLMDGVDAQVDESHRLVIDSPYAMERPLTMGDLAEMSDTRHFILRGRSDRRVKILEHYVSLTAVEKCLSNHPFVDRVCAGVFGESIPRLGAVIELSDEGRASVIRDGFDTVASSMRAFLKARLDSISLPRRFRFVRELPANAQGKTTASMIGSALSRWCREPVVTKWRATSEALDAELVFQKDMECFQGHFPGFPVLPGVAQLYFLRHFARQVFQDWPEAAAYRKLKFQKLIRPGIPVTLRVARRGCCEFEFEMSIAGGRSTSGIVEPCGNAL